MAVAPSASITTSHAAICEAEAVPTWTMLPSSMTIESPGATGSRQSPVRMTPRLTIAVFMPSVDMRLEKPGEQRIQRYGLLHRDHVTGVRDQPILRTGNKRRNLFHPLRLRQHVLLPGHHQRRHGDAWQIVR